MTAPVLVTGHQGLVGSHVARLLSGAGVEVLGVSRGARSEGPVKALAIDLAEPCALAALERLGPLRAVVHCAASFPAVFDTAESDVIAARNRAMDETVVALCRLRGARLVYCSSSSVYADLTSEPVTEAAPLSQAGGYVGEKIWAEQEIRRQLDSHAILRICAPYGPGQATRTVLRIFVERALQGQDLLFFGTGAREQDFVHAHDVALAVQAALARPDINGVFNVSGGRPISMRGLGELVNAVVAHGALAVRAAGRPDPQDGFYARFDGAAALAGLGWRATVTLEEGVADMARRLSGSAHAARADL
ncbi:NAD(P)-dependent oxidoreductase [Achromobacter xylosoxidans]|uniref:NAD-dependent epimerase/dehydratase family protein n=1 Tax=Achromobacter TaxID=222 RepID=UPI001565E267|nr:NAD(P)-dependent oxidoreductase [Achromobacter xylosoxidans]QKI70423.1 NAD(P)-dependent oxidoreductase [Achromobacter xylosoxidans]